MTKSSLEYKICGDMVPFFLGYARPTTMCLAITTEPDMPSRLAMSTNIFGKPSGSNVGSSATLPRFQIGAGAFAISPNGKPTINTSWELDYI